jgi:hypothetical protein
MKCVREGIPDLSNTPILEDISSTCRFIYWCYFCLILACTIDNIFTSLYIFKYDIQVSTIDE